MQLKIKPFNDAVRSLYEKHGHHHAGDAGLDLFITEPVTVRAGETVALHLGIACEPVNGRAYFLMPRSSVSKTPLRQANSVGLIDGGYRGEIIAVVDNIKNQDYTVDAGDRLFQIVAIDGSPIDFELVETLSETSRGSGGFGSTGR